MYWYDVVDMSFIRLAESHGVIICTIGTAYLAA
jgi:hypothetical protein